MSVHKAHIVYRVPYADTDQMGVVYYANYLIYFEILRSQLLRDLGLPYGELERRGFALPVIEAHVNYRASARYDDELDVYGWLGAIKGVRVRVDCEVRCRAALLATGHTLHAFVERSSLKPTRVIPELAACAPGDAAPG